MKSTHTPNQKEYTQKLTSFTKHTSAKRKYRSDTRLYKYYCCRNTSRFIRNLHSGVIFFLYEGYPGVDEVKN